MKKQTKILVSVLVIVLVSVGIGHVILRSQGSVTVPTFQVRSPFIPDAPTSFLSPSPVSSEVTVSLDFGDGQKITAQTQAPNAYQALVNVGKQKGFRIEVQQYKYGVMVTGIGDKKGTDQLIWRYKVNGKGGDVASDRFIIHPADTVEWVYVKN